MEKNRKKWLIIVNLITLSRIVGSIVLFPIFFCFGKYVAGITLALLFATDSIDGILARKYHVSTFFGSIIDGICDKVMVIVSCILMCFINKIMIVSIILEALIFLVNVFALTQNGNVKSSRIGKLKMWVLTVFITLGFFVLKPGNTLINFIVYIPVFVFELVTLLDYIIKASKLKISFSLKVPKYKSSKDVKWMLFNPEFYDAHKDDKALISHIYKNEKK